VSVRSTAGQGRQPSGKTIGFAKEEEFDIIMRTKISSIALALLVGVGSGQALQAKECSVSQFVGVYGMSAAGAVLVAPGFPSQLLGPFGRVGRVAADGVGNVSVANTASYNGTIIAETYSGTYTVDIDCNVDIKVTVGLPIGAGGALEPVPFEFVGAMADNGSSVAVLACGLGPGVPCFPVSSALTGAAPTGNVIRVLLSRESAALTTGQCATENLVGAYQLDMSGTDLTGSQPVPFARDGWVAFDSRGIFSGHATVSDGGGAVTVEVIAGAYTVSSLCNLAISYGFGGKSHLWTGTLTNQGNGANLIVSETGYVITGTMTAELPNTAAPLAPRR
jgi:hypothetical protein